MTCITAAVVDRKTVMYGDSSAVSGNTMTKWASSKIFMRGPFMIGYTSSFRMGQLLEFALDIPKPPRVITMDYMVLEFVETVRQCFVNGGYNWNENGRDTGGTFIVAAGNRIFEIESDYQVGEPMCGYTAVGSGMTYALGAMHTAHELGCDAQGIARHGINAAVEHCTTVEGPLDMLTQGGPNQ